MSDSGDTVSESGDTGAGTGSGAVTTFLLVCAQVAIALFGAMLSFGMAMGSASCGYSECGNQAWIGPGMMLGIFGGAPLFLVNVVGCCVLIARDRSGLRFARICCAIQVAFVVLAMMMFGLASSPS